MMTADELAAYEKTYPLGVCTPAGLAGPVAFLLSDDAREMTGQDIVVDGGVGLSR